MSVTVTYQLDKKIAYDSINVVRRFGQPTTGYLSYTHISTNLLVNSTVLYNSQKPQNYSKREIEEIQNQIYTNVTVYMGGRALLPLIVRFDKDDAKLFYRHIKNEENDYWEKIVQPDNELETTGAFLIEELRVTQDNLLNSIVILLDKLVPYNNSDVNVFIKKVPFNRVTGNNIIVNQNAQKCAYIKSHGYKLYEQDLSKMALDHEICPIKFLIPLNNGPNFLMVTNKGNGRENIYFRGQNVRLYVIFHGNDPRPLLFCYDNSAYMPESKDHYEKKWTKVNGLSISTRHLTPWITTCTSHELLLNTLKQVCSFMNPVDIEKNVDGDTQGTSYVAYEFNGERININLSKITYDWYTKLTHRRNENYRLGNIIHSKTSIKSKGEVISAYEYRSVSAFYLKFDSELRYPIIIALSNDGNCNEWYKVTKISEDCEFEKVNQSIDLNFKDTITDKMREITNKLSSYDKETIVQLYMKQTDQNREKYEKLLSENVEKLSYNLMKTILPVGSIYTVAGASLYPVSVFIHSFMAMI